MWHMTGGTKPLGEQESHVLCVMMQYFIFSVALSRGKMKERHRERELGPNKINSHGLRERHTTFDW